MIDRTAQMKGIYGSRDFTPMGRRVSKLRAAKRSRVAGRRDIVSQLAGEVEYEVFLEKQAEAAVEGERLELAEAQAREYIELKRKLVELESRMEPEAFTVLFALGYMGLFS